MLTLVAEHLVHQLGVTIPPVALYAFFCVLDLNLWQRMLDAWPYSERTLTCTLLYWLHAGMYLGT